MVLFYELHFLNSLLRIRNWSTILVSISTQYAVSVGQNGGRVYGAEESQS
jgi:hypothetical protein